MQSTAQILVLSADSDKVSVSHHGKLVNKFDVRAGFRISADFAKATAPSGHTDFNTAVVKFIDEEECLPPEFIGQVPVGPKEFFATQANLRYGGVERLTAGLHVTWAKSGATSYCFVLGGPKTAVKIPLSRFLGLETRERGPDEAALIFTFDPASIEFSNNKSVTNWRYIKTMFPDLHLSQNSSIDLDEILVRVRIRANLSEEGESHPSLLLEAIVIKDGTWEGVAQPTMIKVSAATSAAIFLWKADIAWCFQVPEHRLITTPGICRSQFGFASPNEFKYRWSLQLAMYRSDHGKSVASREEFLAYWENPTPTFADPSPVFWLPNPFKGMPVASKDQGRRNFDFVTFKRNGKTFKRTVKPVVKFPKPSKPAKYNTLPGAIHLQDNALPVDTPQELREAAKNLFNASITDQTGKGYATTARRVKSLEDLIGRSFSWPLPEMDLSLITTYLISKGGVKGKKLRPKTINKHLSGVRRISLAMGAPMPKKILGLTKALLKGNENLCRDPAVAVAKATHRPISIPFLRLLGHAVSKHWKGRKEDGWTFWTICKIAFWGSFRVGELLTEGATTYSPKSDFLGSDLLWMSDTSLALWIRDPKISKEFGDVIEIWKTPQFPDLDPWSTFRSYWERRKFMKAPLTLPLFLRADGLSFSHRYFDTCLAELISRYSVQIEIGRNNWTGRSFRSGLPTVLQTAGFSDKEIKKWGRWSSDAFLLYTRDMSQRSKVQGKMVAALDRVRKSLCI